MSRTRIQGMDQVFANARRVGNNMKAGTGRDFAVLSARAENTAKSKRSWTDRTGNARRSIRGSSEVQRNKVIAALAIGVDYGKYLELSNAGKYAIVWSTVMSYRQQYLMSIQRNFRL